MAASTVIVQHRDGSPARRVRIVLGFRNGGMTKDVYADDKGRAVVEHTSVGQADVFVSGKKVGTMHAPGSFAVTI